ncbi:wiskott-Aldrich syndrome protein family member 1-like [Phyllostomus hastatus]|uniref:wiskott-Aldrich syndrome protein family member 1-like n=1 Tax=Phyllostomus hastatus TaxID=9423 RepID=UPI001E6840D6|nr:wiskott-Aldrich syndrome protein family member 1-like [Phyllostomus hastatus]
MWSNEQKDEGDPNTLEIPANTQEELIQIIETSLHNIVTQVNTLSKRAVDMIDEMFEETDRLSFQVTVLEEQVIRKTNTVTYKDQNGGLPLRVTESETFQSTTIQTQQVYSSKQVPVKMCERHDTHGLTLPMNRSSPFVPDDTGGLEVSPDASYCFELHKEKTARESEEAKGARRKQKQPKDHRNKPASVPQTQRMGDISVHHVPAACSAASRSHADQPDESCSFSSFPLCEINKVVTRAVETVISSSHYLPMHESREVKNPPTYVRYGTGKGEELKPQPQTRLKTKVFVSPTAPASAPALPADWLAALRAPKVETPSSSIHVPTQLPSPALRTAAATSLAACRPGAPDRAVPIIPPKGAFSTPATEPFPYYELTTHDLLAQAEYQGLPPPLSSSAVTSRSVQTEVTVSHLSGRASVVQSATASVTKLSKSSIPSSPRSSLSPSLSYRIPPPRFPVTLLPRSSNPQNSSPLSPTSSRPQTSRAQIPSPRNSLSPSTRSSDTTRSRRSGTQSSAVTFKPSKPSAAQSQRPSTAQSTRHLMPPQQNSARAQSAKSSTGQSSIPFVQSPSRTLSSPGRSVTPPARAPMTATFQQSPPDLSLIARVKNAVMAAVRKSVLLHNSEDQ